MTFVPWARTLLLLLAALASAWPAGADAVVDLDTDVTVEAATASPARKGESSRIRFRLVNEGSAALHITGIETDLAERTQLVGRIGAVRTAVLDSIGAPSGETLDLTTSHLWFEIDPLERDLREGETFDVRLNFVEGSISVPVHVHEPGLEGGFSSSGGPRRIRTQALTGGKRPSYVRSRSGAAIQSRPDCLHLLDLLPLAL